MDAFEAKLRSSLPSDVRPSLRAEIARLESHLLGSRLEGYAKLKRQYNVLCEIIAHVGPDPKMSIVELVMSA